MASSNNMTEMQHESEQEATAADEEALNELTAQLSKFDWKEGVVDREKYLLYSSDIQDNIKGVTNLKAMLCIGREEVYEVAQEVIDSGVISRLVHFLTIDQRDLQWPSAFCLTNIAAGHDEQTQIVVEAGAIPLLIKFLRHSDPQLRRQAIFCLANVAGSTQEYRKMLATHPDYFPSMISAGKISSDARVLELVCWNLRNVCLLGGPAFDQIKLGIDYLLNSILKRFLQYQHWSGCVRYALEAITAVCRIEEGRQFLIEQGLMQCLLSLMKNMSSTLSSISQSTFEACAWLLGFGTYEEKQLFAQNYVCISNIIDQAIQGNFGDVIQELGLKCLVFIATDPNKNLLLSMIESHHALIHLVAQIFMEINVSSAKGFGQQRYRAAFNGEARSNTITHLPVHLKEYAGFICVQSLLLARYISSLHMKFLVSDDVVKVLIEVIEFGSEELRGEQYGNIAATTDHASEEICGPPIPSLSESLTVSALLALSQHINEGETVRFSEDLLQNPIMLMCFENDIPNRLKQVLTTTALPEEGYGLGNKLLQRCISEAPNPSNIFGCS